MMRTKNNNSQLPINTTDSTAALAYANENRSRFLEELIEFLRFPSVGASPVYKAETVQAAHWLADQARKIGLNHVEVIQTMGNPLVYGDWLEAGNDLPTILIYGHYDVQPPDPLEAWITPPFEPEVRDHFIYARGAADDKGQLYLHLKALESYLISCGSLPVNVKVIFEGEEESGGRSIEAFIREHGSRLSADIALASDTHMLSPEQPLIVYGLRGMCYTFLDISGPGRDLHSGSFGGAINNPINAMSQIIASLKDENGKILIPGFYDKVRPLKRAERELLAQHPLNEQEWLASTGAPQLWGEAGYTLTERIGTRPTLDVNGISGGYTGQGAKTVLPAEAHAKISMRLVPDQDPHEIYSLFESYVKQLAPPSVDVKCTYVHGAAASVIDHSVPPIQAAAAAYNEVFQNQPIYVREGGSIPVVSLFKKYLGLETILMGFGLPEDHIHAPNERFYLPNFFNGIRTAIVFLERYAGQAART